MIYKKIVLFLVFSLLISSFVFAQKRKKKDAEAADTTATKTTITQPVNTAPPTQAPAEVATTPENDRIKTLQIMYALGFRYYDLSVSQMALYEMIALNPRNIALRDSLALLYYNMGKYGAAIAVCTDVLSVEKNNLAMLEVRALSNENLSFYNEAILDYEKLNIISPNVYTLYKIASLQYNLKRYQEAKTNIDILLENKEIDPLKIAVSITKIEQQEVPMKAAVLNLRGLIYEAMGNKDIAQKSFAESIKVAPNFKIAKENLAALNKPKGK